MINMLDAQVFERDIKEAFEHHAEPLAQALKTIRSESSPLIEQAKKEQEAKEKKAQGNQRSRGGGRSSASRYFTSQSRGGHRWQRPSMGGSSGRSSSKGSSRSSGGSYRSSGSTFNPSSGSSSSGGNRSSFNNKRPDASSDTGLAKKENTPKSTTIVDKPSDKKKETDIKKTQLSESATALIEQCKDFNKLMAGKSDKSTLYNQLLGQRMLSRLNGAITKFTSGVSNLGADDAKAVKGKAEVTKAIQSSLGNIMTLAFYDNASSDEQKEIIAMLKAEEQKIFGKQGNIKQQVIQKENEKTTQYSKELKAIIGNKKLAVADRKQKLNDLLPKINQLQNKVPVEWSTKFYELEALKTKITKERDKPERSIE